MSAPLAAGWQQLTAPDGRAYFYNPATKETTWSPPSSGAPAHPPAAAHHPAPVAAHASSAPAQPASHPSTAVVHQKQHAAAPGQSAMSDGRYTLQSLVQRTGQRERGQGLFELERDKLLEINLGPHDKMAWIKLGSMIARRGKVKFTRQGMSEQGIGKLMKKALTGEGVKLAKVEGHGKVFCADGGKAVSVVHLKNETLYINGNDVLAMSGSVKYDIKLMKGAGMLSGGLFNVKVSGTGMVAFTCHGSVVTLTATANDPVYSDPHATVAPTFHTDVSMKALYGKTSGEEVQMCFKSGYVIVQPYEEITPQAPSSGGGGASALGNVVGAFV